MQRTAIEMLLLAFTGIPHLATNGKTTLQNLVHETLGLLVSLQGRPEDPLQCLIIILLSTHPLEVHDAKLELSLVQAINGCTFAPLIGKVSIFEFSVTLLVESAEVHLCSCITEISMVMQDWVRLVETPLAIGLDTGLEISGCNTFE
jgi:hypothetical protein